MKRAMGSKGLRINMEKTKMMVSGSSVKKLVQRGGIPVECVAMEWD